MIEPPSTGSITNLPAVRADVTRAEDDPIGREDREALRAAMRALEHANLATRIANALGRQLGTLGRFLPIGVSGVVNAAAERAIGTAMTVALRSLGKPAKRDSRLAHKIASAAAGAAGGAFGLASLPIELPLSTLIILRSIADIARREGEDLSNPEAALACLEVFALGAHDRDDTYVDSGYFAVRGLLAKTVSEAIRYAVAQGVSTDSAPILLRLVTQIAGRFGIVVSEKLAAQAVPIVGAAGGAAVNYAFAEHFQSLAYGHFTVRRLERRYGGAVVKAEYDRLVLAMNQAA
jgi:hypothetical protein